MLSVVALLVVAQPLEARFVLEVASVPVATIRVSVQGDTYFYGATHFLEEGDRNFSRRLTLSSLGARPEVLALARPPDGLGCEEVIEERTEKRESLCISAQVGTEVRGTLDGTAFVARYRDGQLQRIKVGAADWTRDDAGLKQPDGRNPFVEGVAVEAGPLALSPAVEGARWLTAPLIGIGGDEVGRTRCLVLARRAAKESPKRRVAIGLVLEGGRAYPHAWVVEGSRQLDPSVRAGDPILLQRRYVELPLKRSGAFYLALFDGDAKVSAPK